MTARVAARVANAREVQQARAETTGARTNAELQGDALEERLALSLSLPADGLGSGGWLAVVCRDDGSATYSVPPTKAVNRVTNADLFCGAFESRLH